MKMQVLESVLPIRDDEVVLGQYEGYTDDPTVPDESNTPTFATVILRIHNERWEGQMKFQHFFPKRNRIPEHLLISLMLNIQKVNEVQIHSSA